VVVLIAGVVYFFQSGLELSPTSPSDSGGECPDPFDSASICVGYPYCKSPDGKYKPAAPPATPGRSWTCPNGFTLMVATVSDVCTVAAGLERDNGVEPGACHPKEVCVQLIVKGKPYTYPTIENTASDCCLAKTNRMCVPNNFG